MEIEAMPPVWSQSGSELLSTLDTLKAAAALLKTYELQIIGRLNEIGTAQELGARDTAELVSLRYRLDPAEVRKDLTFTAHLHKYPAVTAALPDPADPSRPATLSPDQAKVIVTTLEKAPSTVPVEHLTVAEQQLIEAARVTNPRELTRFAHKVLATLDTDGPEPAEDEARAKESLRLRRSDGGVKFNGFLAGDSAELLETQIHKLSKPHKTIDGELDPRPRDNRQADALRTILDAAAGNPDYPGVPHLTVTIDFNDLKSALAAAPAAGGSALNGPGTRGTAGAPAAPGVSGTLGTPNAYGASAASGMTDTPAVLGAPTEASSPGTRDGSGAPAAPGTLSTPDVFGASAAPSTLAAPGTLGTHDESGTAAAPGVTDTPAVLGAPTETSSPGTRDGSGTPAAPGTIGAPGARTAPGTLGAPDVFGASAAPSTLAAPGVPGTPDAFGTPTAPWSPGTPDGFGAATAPDMIGGSAVSAASGVSAAPGTPDAFGASAVPAAPGAAGAAGRSAAVGELVFGGNLSAAAVRLIACDAAVLPIILGGDSQPLDIGTEQRFVNRYLRRALNKRDKGCVICKAPPWMCHAHHLTHWANGGPTSLHNLALLCALHHRAVHTGQWTLTITQGVLHITRPTWADPPHPNPTALAHLIPWNTPAHNTSRDRVGNSTAASSTSASSTGASSTGPDEVGVRAKAASANNAGARSSGAINASGNASSATSRGASAGIVGVGASSAGANRAGVSSNPTHEQSGRLPAGCTLPNVTLAAAREALRTRLTALAPNHSDPWATDATPAAGP